jgi:sugar phosphate isomerase/epimerase
MSRGSCSSTSGGCCTDVAERGRTPLPLAVQLYTFRDPARFGGAGMGLDVPALTAIAGAGFLGVETVDVPGGDPADARRVLADLDLVVTSSHTWSHWSDPDALHRASDAISALGSPRIIVSPGQDDLRDGGSALVDRLAESAEVVAERGLRLGIHTHDGEMQLVEGQRIIDRLAGALGDTVDIQIDIFWAVVAGADPAEVIRDLGSGVVSLHLKDGVTLPPSASGDTPFVNVAVGSGAVDPAPAVAAAEASGSAEWLIVEFDHVDGSAVDATRASLENLVARGLARARTS